MTTSYGQMQTKIYRSEMQQVTAHTRSNAE